MESPTNNCLIDLTIVVPVKDEASSVMLFLSKIVPCCEQLACDYEILFINDGSRDQTQAVLMAACVENSHLRLIKLSRNFGKEFALSAGLDYARGKAVIPMDVDLQDPPELIGQLYEKYLEGFDSVLAVRRSRGGDNLSKRFFASLFHRIFRTLSEVEVIENVGDFRLINRKVLDVVNSMPERTRFMKGLLSWPGFSVATVYFDRNSRQQGSSKWGFTKLWRLALDGIFSFSTLPLKVWTYMGGALASMSILYMIFTVVKTVVLGVDVPGYASLLSVTLLIGGVNLMGIGILGEYISRIFIEVKGRPIYVVESVYQAELTELAKTACDDGGHPSEINS